MSDESKTIVLPDGSAVATASWALPKDHWLFAEGSEEPPMGLRCGTDDPMRKIFAERIREAAKYAVRGATMNGTTDNFDPDAIVQNMIVGLLGYFSADGL